jgi:hypothetical protein
MAISQPTGPAFFPPQRRPTINTKTVAMGAKANNQVWGLMAEVGMVQGLVQISDDVLRILNAYA